MIVICCGEMKKGYNCKANNEGFDYNVTHALYLDMGRGWNYAWYRIRKGRKLCVILHLQNN